MQNTHQNPATRILASQAGFSLIEMLIVLALMALAGTFVTTSIMKRFDEAKVSSTKIQIRQLGTVLDDFRRVCGSYPSTEQGLEALVKAPQGRECKNYDPEGFIKGGRVPKDAWDRDFVFISDSSKYEMKSLGGDGKEGGSGVDKDISSNELE